MTPAQAAAPLDRARAEDARLLMSTYRRQPVLFVRGEGTRLYDAEGREYLDLVAGIAVNILGHCPPVLRATLEEQASNLVHLSNLYYSEPMLAAAALLVESAFPARVFFCNSGAEANEAMIKIARKWGARHRGGAHRIVCLRGAFHGRTLATLAATGNEAYLAPFEPRVEGFDHVDRTDIDGVAERLRDGAVAVMVEPVQGESGIHPLPDETLRALRALCDRHEALLLVDEVQSGMGRTGRMWAHQHAGVVPDVMTVAKGLGAGFPVGAVLAGPRADVLEPGDHGCTFGGNPLATAVAAAVLRTVRDHDLPARAERLGERLRAAIDAIGSPVQGVRGRGLMLAVGLEREIAPQVAVAALGHGLVVNATGPATLRLVPPLTISETEVDTAVMRLRAALEEIA